MKLKLLLISILLIQNPLIGQDIANEYFEEVTGIESVDNYVLYLEKCDSVLALKPDDFNSRLSKALIFAFKNQYQLERQEYRSILLLDSTNADIYYNLAASYINQHENLIYVPEELDYERERTERKNHWDCMGDQKECMDIAQLIYPLIKSGALVDTTTVSDFPNLKQMEFSLGEFLNEKK